MFETFLCISILWFIPCFVIWLLVLEWIFEFECLTVGHIFFTIFTYPMTLVVIAIYILYQIVKGFIYLCNIKIGLK